MEILYSSLGILLFLLPYGVLFVKGISISVKLLFVFVIEFGLIGLLGTALYFSGKSMLVAVLFYYSVFGGLSGFLNIGLIVLIWLVKRIKALWFLSQKG